MKSFILYFEDIFLVSDTPVFTMEPEDVSGDAGQEIVLVCQAEGNPSPSYRWFRNMDREIVI